MIYEIGKIFYGIALLYHGLFFLVVFLNAIGLVKKDTVIYEFFNLDNEKVLLHFLFVALGIVFISLVYPFLIGDNEYSFASESKNIKEEFSKLDDEITSKNEVLTSELKRLESLQKNKCSEFECLYNNKCFYKPENSYCTKGDKKNAWKCKTGFIEVFSAGTGKNFLPPTMICIQKLEKNTHTCNAYVKGNIAYNTGEKLYHIPGCDNYNDVVINPAYGEKYFCSEKEAKNAGWRKAWNCP